MELRIKEGYCYQVIDGLLDVTTPSTSNMLNKLALTKGAIEVSKEFAIDRGFDELANWSAPEHDRLFVINDNILVCLPKEVEPYA
jgi:hypothetical protein